MPRIKDFYKGFKPEDKSEVVNKNTLDMIVFDEENLKFCQLVFSPDPLTGNPTSEVAYMLSGSDEGFKQFLKDKLFNAIPQGPLADNPDEAMQLVKKNAYTQDQFVDICKQYVISLQQQQLQQEGGN